jgi:DNA repair protein RadC
MTNKYKVPIYKLKLTRTNKCNDPVLLSPWISPIIFHDLIGDIQYEEMWVLMTDAFSKITGAIKLSQGGKHGTSVLVSDIFRPLMVHGATGFVLGHNHPSGDPTPSNEDIELTTEIKKIGKLLSIHLLDHIVIAHDGITNKKASKSMFEMGLLD